MAILKKEVIIDRWSMVVKDAQGKQEQVYKDTESAIQKSDPPKVDFKRIQVSPGLLQGLMGTSRTFILVTNKDLPGYNMYVSARDYGNNLDLSWFLTYQPGFIQQLINFFLGWLFKKTLVPVLDLFQEQDLRAYATVVHHGFIESVEVITKGAGITIDRKTSGFLGIS